MVHVSVCTKVIAIQLSKHSASVVGHVVLAKCELFSPNEEIGKFAGKHPTGIQIRILLRNVLVDHAVRHGDRPVPLIHRFALKLAIISRNCDFLIATSIAEPYLTYLRHQYTYLEISSNNTNDFFLIFSSS